MPLTAEAAASDRHAVKVAMANGQIMEGPLCPRRQARLYSLIVHDDQFGAVEAVRAIRPEGGKRLFFPHRAAGRGDTWLPADDPDELGGFVEAYRDEYELFVTPASFDTMTPGAEGVSGARVAWIDQDDPEKVDLLRTFDRRPHMVVATGGSGGVHAFWRLSVPVGGDEIGVVNRKLTGHLKSDPAAHNPARILRIPGSQNLKANQGEGADGLCRIIWADLHSPPYDPEQLVEGLSDYRQPGRPSRYRQYRYAGYKPSSDSWVAATVDEAEGSSPPEYVYRLTGHQVATGGGYIHCPFSDHEDRNPSTFVYGDVAAGWFCFSCQRGGGPFQLAAALNGWTGGGELRQSEFTDAARSLASALGIEQKEK